MSNQPSFESTGLALCERQGISKNELNDLSNQEVDEWNKELRMLGFLIN